MKQPEVNLDTYLDSHYIHRSNWLRAAVLGANDGIISVSSIAIGIAAASSAREPIMLATIAGLTAGALSMAAGEYISVSSQADTEKANNVLGWKAGLSLEDALASAWKWEQKIRS